MAEENENTETNEDESQEETSEESEKEEKIGAAIVHGAYTVHKALGPGLLEKVYEICLTHELEKVGFKVERQAVVPIIYDNLKFEEGFRADLLVENLVIVETKAIEHVHPIWHAQILSHIKLLNLNLGFLINFHVRRIRDGIKRYRI